MSFVTKNHFLAVIAALLCIPLIFSFSSSDSKQNEELFSDCLFSISYDQTKESYLRLPDDGSIANLNAREIVKHKRKMEKKHIEKCLDSRKNFKITIQHLNHQEVLESWMPQVATTVIDFTGIKLLDPNGNILKERPLSKDEMTAHFNSSKSLFLNTERLKVLNETEKQELRSSGLTVEEKGQDKLKIYNNLWKVIYDPQNNYIEQEEKNEDGSLIKRTKKTYVIIPNQSRDGEYVLPGYDEEAEPFESDDRAACGEIVITSNNSNYTINNGAGYYEDTPNNPSQTVKTAELEIKIQPNPTYEQLELTLPNNNLPDKIDVVLIDAYGRKIKELRNQSAGATLNMDLKNLAAGIYFIQVKQGASITTKKFLKK